MTYIINNIKAGDYLFVQFAHNDASQKLTENEFKNLLNQYIDAARANGAYPVFVTSPYPLKSVADEKTDGVYTVTDELRGFPQLMREVAALHDVPVLDLNAGWTKVLEKEGKTGAGQYYVDDGIHYNLAGNNKLCEILISEINRIKLPLASCIK